MIVLKLNGTTYKAVSDWSDMTISQAAALLSIRMPDTLKDIYTQYRNPGNLSPEENKKRIEELEVSMSFEDQHKNLPMYFSHVIEALSDIPGDILKKTDINSIKVLYHTYMKQFVEGVHFYPLGYQYHDISSFDFRGETYYLPVNREIFAEAVPMVDVTALEFCESADLMIHVSTLSTQREFSRVANIIAILCRPKGEEYNETVSLERAKDFLELPMDLCWNVFFSLITPLIIAGQCAQISLLEEIVKEGENTLTS